MQLPEQTMHGHSLVLAVMVAPQGGTGLNGQSIHMERWAHPRRQTASRNKDEKAKTEQNEGKKQTEQKTNIDPTFVKIAAGKTWSDY